MMPLKLTIDFEEGILGTLDELKLARAEPSRQSSDLSADGPARTGDEHSLPTKDPVDAARIDRMGFAADQLSNIDAAFAGGH
ncbi:MAG: hypothetical protein WD749_12650 [Phycisphaerales bacterium]